MKVTVIRPFLTREGITQEGQIIDVSEIRARELEDNGLIISAIDKSRLPREAVPANETRPIVTRPTGSQTGAEKAASLSPPDPQPAKRTYRRRKAARAAS